MKLPVRDGKGKEVEKIDVDDAVFGIEPNKAVIHQVYVAQMNARRGGVANTKSRGEVRASTAKLRSQKGLGRARIGSAGSPVLTGGGVAFGPSTRSYAQSVPKRIKRLAIRSVLSAKASAGQLHIIDSAGDGASTKALKALLATLGVERSLLLVTGEKNRDASLSARNLEGARVMPAGYLNVADMVNHQSLVMTTEAVRAAEALWGGDRVNSRRAVVTDGAPTEKATPRRKTRATTAKASAPTSSADTKKTEAAAPKKTATTGKAPTRSKATTTAKAPAKAGATGARAKAPAKTAAKRKPAARKTPSKDKKA